MIKKFIAIFSVVFFVSTVQASSCIPASSTTINKFCSSFKTAAECHCTSSGLPKGMCSNMNQLYSRMVAMFRSVEKACQFQHDVPPQTCIDDWNCYRQGGRNSEGGLCSGTGKACE